MGVINPVGTISPIWREQVVANPPQSSAITSGGGAASNTATIGTAQTGINVGALVRVHSTANADETMQVASYVSGTGVITFTANLANDHSGGGGTVNWGYGGTVYDGASRNGGWGFTANGEQTPNGAGNVASTLFVNNEKVRDWDLQLRQSCRYS